MTTRMPFGKHKNVPVNDVPTDYLVWCIESMENLKGWLRQVILTELRSRGIVFDLPDDEPCPVCGRVEMPSVPSDTVKAFDRVYRRLALALHPDRGGSNEAMRALNEARDQFLEETQS